MSIYYVGIDIVIFWCRDTRFDFIIDGNSSGYTTLSARLCVGKTYGTAY